MLIQITDAGLALMEGATQPLVMTSYQLGSSHGYTPSTTQTALQGTLLYTGVPSAPVAAGINTLLYACYVPGSVGTFQFGEIALFYNSTLFAICVLDELIDKAPLDPNTNTGGPVVIDFFVPITSTNYQMWANATQANTLKASTVTGPEGLPPSPNAVPNVFVVEPVGVGQTFLAFSDRFGVWSFTGFGEVTTATVVSADANSVTVPTSSVSSLVYQGLGTLMTQFTSGAAYSTTRYIDAMTPSGANTVLSFNAPLTIIPNAGDTLVLYEPLAAQTPSGSIPPGVFTTLTSTGNTSLGPAQAISLNATPIGATTPSSGAFTTLSATGNTTLAAVTATSLDGAVIGATTPTNGTFTNLVVTNSLSGPGLNTLFQSPGPIGATTPSTGAFSALTVTGATTLAGVTATSLDGAAIGATTPSAGKFTTLQTTGPATLAGLVVSGNSVLQGVTATTVTASGALAGASLNISGSASFASLNSTPIGQTTPAAGAFTNLTATGTVNLGITTAGALTATSLNSTPIGATTPASGKFTTLQATGNATFAAVTATSFSAASIDATPIGQTTAAAGAFTTLVTSGLATLNSGISLAGSVSQLLLSGSAGTVGQVLTSAGPGATPTWSSAVVSGGSPAFAALTVTGATILNTMRASAIDNSPIGATTPATGKFTTLQATASVTTPALTLSGPITLGASSGTAGQVLLSAGAGTPTWGTAVMTGSSPTFPALTVSGTATIDTTAVTNANLTNANVGKLTLTANQPLTVNGSAGTSGQVLTSAGAGVAPSWTNLVVTNAALTSGTINGVVIGGSNPAAATFTSVNLSGLTSPMLLSGAAGTLGQVLTSQGAGATPIWTTPSSGGGGGSVAAITSGTIDGATIGGTNPAPATFTTLAVQTSSTLAATTTTTLTTNYLIVAANTAFSINGSTGVSGQVLTSNGSSAAPTWVSPSFPSTAVGITITGSTVDSTPVGATTPSTGAFTSLTLASTTSPILLNASAGTAGQVLTSAGPGATPTWTTVGGGSVAAITSGTIDGATIGATTPSTGAFTTLSASGGLTLTGTAPLLLGASAGTAGQVLTSAGAGAAPTWTTISSGGTPGGATTQLQYNNAGAFGGMAGVTWDGTNLTSTADIFVSGHRIGKGNGADANSVALGLNALNPGTAYTGTRNVAVGSGALSAVTTGSRNIAIGYNTLASASFVGTDNVMIGDQVGSSIVSGSSNVIIGGITSGNATSSNNTIVGVNAGSGGSGGSNTFIGTAAGTGSTGSGNTFVGASAGSGTVSGSNNVIIGAATTPVTASSSNNIVLSDGAANLRAYWENSATRWNFPTGAIAFAGAEGTAGQVLSSAGAGASPTWVTPTTFNGGTLTTALNEAPIVTLASAATVNIGAAAANTISISGTTAITAFDTIANGAVRNLIFQNILTLTYNATSMILPTGANIVTATDDRATFISLGAGNWKCIGYQRASGAALSGTGSGNVTGPGVSVDGEVALFNGTSGTSLKRLSGSGYIQVTSGVASVIPVATLRSQIGQRVQSVTYAATITLDATLADNFRFTLTGNTVLANPTGLIDGQGICVRVKQDATGNRTMTYGSKFKFPDGVAPLLSTAANAQDFLNCVYDATDDSLYCVLTRNFA